MTGSSCTSPSSTPSLGRIRGWVWVIIMPPCLPESLHHPVMSCSGDDWLTDSGDHELGDDVGGDESDLPDSKTRIKMVME